MILGSLIAGMRALQRNAWSDIVDIG